MPNGLWPAGGKSFPQTDERAAASAFSKGDLLAITSSGFSRLNPYALGSGVLYGIATCDSTQSIDGLCTACVASPEHLYWSRTTAGVTLAAGDESALSFVASAPGRYWADDSTTTSSVVVVRGTADVDQSVESKVLVKLKYAGGELDLS